MNNRLAVIFDMDGVLVDSYHAHFKSWQVVAAAEGRHMTEAEFASQFGRTSREIIAGWWDDGRYSEQQIAALDDRKEAAFREILAADFPAMAGATELLQSLQEDGFALGLGSSGPPENVGLVLDKLGARRLFEAVVTGADVTRGKPDPQVFLIAAERLGVPPRCCAVVEDARAGIEAAAAAGMASVGIVSTGRHREEFLDADRVIESLDELSPEAVRSMLTGRGR